MLRTRERAANSLRTGNAAPRPRTGRRARRGRARLLLRRLHLYSGLALLPWVVLYGFTALLFNHAGWWSDTRERALAPLGAQGTPLRPLLDAPLQAGEVLASLAERAGLPAADLRLVEGSARWIGALQLEGRGREQNDGEVDVRLALDPRGAGGLLRRTANDAPQARPDWADEERSPVAALQDGERERLLEAAGELARQHGIALGSLNVRRLPELEFRVDDGARTWDCSVAHDGRLEVLPGDAPTDWRRRWLRLHVQHGDSGHSDPRRAWARIVDAVGVAMLLWGASGAVMWWTIRPTRRTGLAALAIGLSGMVWMATALWAATGN